MILEARCAPEEDGKLSPPWMFAALKDNEHFSLPLKYASHKCHLYMMALGWMLGICALKRLQIEHVDNVELDHCTLCASMNKDGLLF